MELNITIKNDSGIQKGIKEIKINGKNIKDNLIPFDLMKETNEIIVKMG